jgi:hypothetical protein
MARKTKHDYYDDICKATAVEPGAQAQKVTGILDTHPAML